MQVTEVTTIGSHAGDQAFGEVAVALLVYSCGNSSQTV